MNAKQLQYIIKLSQTLNFSQVAEELNISQPALSKQVLSVEKELGVKLFDRNTVPMTITPAGEFFVQEAQELLYKQDQLKRSIQRFQSGEMGRLVIGISPFRSLYLVPHMVQKVRERFPGIQICLHETNSDQLRKECAEGKYDFAVINLPVDTSVLDVIPLEPDTLVLAVPNAMLDNLPCSKAGSVTQIDFADCKDLPFITVGQSQEMRRLFDRLCAQAGFHPTVSMEVVGVTTAWAMCHAGVGATLLPLQFISDEAFDKDISLFTLKSFTSTREPAIVLRRGQYLSECAKYAIDLLVKGSSGKEKDHS